MQAFFLGQASPETLLGAARRFPLATDTSAARPQTLGGRHGSGLPMGWVVSSDLAPNEWDAAHV